MEDEEQRASTASQPSLTPPAKRLADVASQAAAGGDQEDEEEAGVDGKGGKAATTTTTTTTKGVAASREQPSLVNVQRWFRALKLEPRTDIHQSETAYVLQVKIVDGGDRDTEACFLLISIRR